MLVPNTLVRILGIALKSQTKPRKHPSQARSRATVEALVEATARTLVRDGDAAASTNRIADKTGVSIGSLYQYFPSKEALVAAVIERHNGGIMRRVRSALTEAASQPFDRAVRSLVSAAVQAHQIKPALHRLLMELVPRVRQMENVEAFHCDDPGIRFSCE